MIRVARIIKSVVVENDYSIDIILLEVSEGYIVVYSGDENSQNSMKY